MSGTPHVPAFTVVVSPPDTTSNWLDFNRPCEDLNSDFLMQPVNEADYDSETQACVDTATGGPASFYDHFVTKRRKKKGVRCTVEGPAPGPPPCRIGLPDPDKLDAPGIRGVPSGSLRDPTIRRIACGVMPPRPAEHAEPSAAAPPYPKSLGPDGCDGP